MRAALEMPLQAGAHMTTSRPDRPAWSSTIDVTLLNLLLLHLQACWVAEEPLGYLDSGRTARQAVYHHTAQYGRSPSAAESLPACAAALCWGVSSSMLLFPLAAAHLGRGLAAPAPAVWHAAQQQQQPRCAGQHNLAAATAAAADAAGRQLCGSLPA
jgi:hypothetical protein